MVAKKLMQFGTVMLLFQVISFILYTLEMHLYMIDVQACKYNHFQSSY